MAESPRTVYFENGAGRIWEVPAGYLRLDYNPGHRAEADFRALLNHLRQAMSRRGWNRALVNQRLMSSFTPRETEWMVNEWLPAAVNENGYRYGAVLLAHDVFARLAMSKVVLATRDLKHQYHNFEEEDEAIAWLLAQK
ncbi:hypothetical protein GCM10023185_12970 [Hymenobacter saemangeumensis]|uniref:STAS/SEC14 domain-containing protein n=1 Tax=Hymenobacter saemangeumensis TaxID=1084522 RepID=A0ABP8I796_9BACT